MQFIARVDRVFRDKPGRIIVDYIGIAQNLEQALNQYTKEKTGIDKEESVAVLMEKYEIVRGMLRSRTAYDRAPRRAAASDHIRKSLSPPKLAFQRVGDC